MMDAADGGVDLPGDSGSGRPETDSPDDGAERPSSPEGEEGSAGSDNPATADGGTEMAEGEFSASATMEALNDAPKLSIDDVVEDGTVDRSRTPREEIESALRNDAEIVEEESGSDDGEEPLVVRELKADLGALETKPRKMLQFYRELGPATPLNAHFAAGGDGDRANAYAHNRTLRTMGVIEHLGRGHYEYRLRHLLAEELENADGATIDAYVRDIEETTDI